MTTAKLALISVVAMALLPACSKPKAPEAAAVNSVGPNVLVITVDTLRADRLGCYGFEAALTANIDRLAKEGVRVEHAVASAPITMPSHTTIFTGLDPPAHGVRDNGTYPVPTEIETLAEQLKRAGYQTQAFVSAEVLHSRYGLAQGFDGYDDRLWSEGEPTEFTRQERPADKTMDRVLEWLNPLDASAHPFFLWVHLFDPHMPYSPPLPEAEAAPSPYDGEIAFVDRQIGRLLEALEKKDVLDETILVFTSDHGESLGEHGEETHAVFIYESTIRVPLIFRYPPKLLGGRVHAESVRGVDLMPTILGLADQAPTKGQGSDLSSALVGLESAAAHPQYSESLYPELAFGMAPLQGLRLDHWTYIRAPHPELYNRATDPEEARNLLDASTDEPGTSEAERRAAEFEQLLSKYIEDSRSLGFVADAKPLDDDTVEMLKALGYMDDADAPPALRGMDPKDGVPIYRKVSEAFRLARGGDCPAAIKVLTPLLKQLPNLVQARNRIAKCELMMGNPEAAKRQYLKSLAHDPDQEGVLLQLGRIELAEGDRDGARRRLLGALEVIPGSVDAMVLLGHLDATEGQPEKAKAWYHKAIEADPGRPIAYLFLGELFLRQGNYADAKGAYEQVRKIAPMDFTASLQLGICTMALGDLKAAEPYFLEASRIDPTQWRPSYHLACVRAQQGDPDGAMGHLGKAVSAGFSDAGQLQRDPCFGPLARDPRFQKLIQGPAAQ